MRNGSQEEGGNVTMCRRDLPQVILALQDPAWKTQRCCPEKGSTKESSLRTGTQAVSHKHRQNASVSSGHILNVQINDN